MTKFTEGPWELGGGENGGLATYVYCDDATGAAVANIEFPHVRRSAEEVRANGLLIAAAPCNYNEHQALLDIVKAAIKAGDWKVDGACDPEQQIERSEAALAKARGEVC